MANHNITMIYLGNYADIDPTEGNFLSENAADLIGTYNDFSTVNVTEVDGDDNGAIVDDEATASAFDRVIYDVPNGTIAVKQDSANLFGARITLADGSTVDLNVNIRQMENGDVFMSSNTGLDNLDIRGIQLLSVQEVNFSGTGVGQSVDNTTVCFGAGTRIATPSGWQAVETLRPGDCVTGRDGSPKRLLWVGIRTVEAPVKDAPIEFAPGALGRDRPLNALLLSPHHRVMVHSLIVKRMFGREDVLVPAKYLVGLPGVVQRHNIERIEYVHILTDQHCVVSAEGVLSETLHLGPMAMTFLTQRQRAELRQINARPGPLCAPDIKGSQARRLIWRHAKNGKALVAPLSLEPA